METCPRCGEDYSYIRAKRVGEQEYLYAVHYLGRGKRKYCYLGPRETYIYGERLNNIGLAGLNNSDRYIKYIVEALQTIAPEDDPNDYWSSLPQTASPEKQRQIVSRHLGRLKKAREELDRAFREAIDRLDRLIEQGERELKLLGEMVGEEE